ncbi:hypothetical protein [Neobacillus sp. SuZ13]|uniref:hypothetical protein n=1 Tax=Neobacillus sp. SuZ13 TaxID=3047875 RepID=UPI0024C06851|nr:hypothetical protein [Neobacillus sp. SuZ13]WHY65642.1 hypothetical protein QNH17_21500 [Neobacillus sp. SuZ13]
MTVEKTLREVVELHGTEEQRKCVLEGKKWRKESNDALMKELDSIYESVDVKGKGYSKKFIFGEEKVIKSDKKDNRVNNGKGQVPLKYEQAFPIMMLQTLLERQDATPLTVIGWLQKMGFITTEMFKACKIRYNDKVLGTESSKLVKLKKINEGEDYLVKDYLVKEVERLSKYFMHVVKKLKDAKIITHQSYTMAKCEIPVINEYYAGGQMVRDVNHQTRYIELSPYVLEQISTIQANLQNSIEFRELTITDINKYKNKPLVMEYWKECKKQLNEVIDESGERLYIELVYDAHALFIKAGRNPIIKWLEKNNREAIDTYNSDDMKYFLENRMEFHETLHNYVVELAEKRQKKFQEDEKAKVSELGGKINLRQFEDDKYKKVKDLMLKGKYVEAYQKLQEYYGYTFK